MSRAAHQDAPTSLLKILVFLWVTVIAFLSYEYLALNKKIPYMSFLAYLKTLGVVPKSVSLSTEPGGSISYILGITGFAVICLTNIYIVKKKRHKHKPTGSLGRWLDFHILFGLLGPTLIVFHSNFQVHGLVAISFWSMMLSLLSGIIGRYFYLQLLKTHQEMRLALDKFETAFEQARVIAPRPWDKKILDQAKWQAFLLVGGSLEMRQGVLALPLVVVHSFIGDFRRRFIHLKIDRSLPKNLGVVLIDYAILQRKYLTSSQYKKLMGYWHAFHKPFAIFMYVVTIIHIISAVTFRIER